MPPLDLLQMVRSYTLRMMTQLDETCGVPGVGWVCFTWERKLNNAFRWKMIVAWKKKGIIFYWLSHQEVEFSVLLLNVDWPLPGLWLTGCKGSEVTWLSSLGPGRYYSFSSCLFGMLPCVQSPSLPAEDWRFSQGVSEDISSHLIWVVPLNNLIGLAFEMTSLQNHESQQNSCFKPLHSGVVCYGPKVIDI